MGIVVLSIEDAEALHEETKNFVTPCPRCDGMVHVRELEDGELKGTCSNEECKINYLVSSSGIG